MSEVILHWMSQHGLLHMPHRQQILAIPLGYESSAVPLDLAIPTRAPSNAARTLRAVAAMLSLAAR